MKSSASGAPRTRKGDQRGLEARAKALVNPASGLANDYLNVFNELIMLLEQLPAIPELIEDISAWQPTTYDEYFRHSVLPGRGSALAAYRSLDSSFRRRFEATVAEMNVLATAYLAVVRGHCLGSAPADSVLLNDFCAQAGAALRVALVHATNLVNYGAGPAPEGAQDRADRLLG